MKKLVYILTIVTIAFTACKKGDVVESTEYTKINVGDPNYTFLRFVNITPGSPSINYYLNGTRSSGAYNALTGETGFTYLSIFPTSGGQFIPVTPGSNKIDAKIVSSATADAGLNVFSTTTSTTGGKYYSLITTGAYTASKTIPSSLLLEEVRPAIDTSKIFVRLVNLFSGGSGANIDMVQKTTGQVLISNVATNAASSFVEIPLPGQANVYTINYTGTATGPVPTFTITSTLTKGQAYTFFVRGVVGNTTYPFGISSLVSFY